jgi:translocation and assembly module TamA
LRSVTKLVPLLGFCSALVSQFSAAIAADVLDLPFLPRATAEPENALKYQVSVNVDGEDDALASLLSSVSVLVTQSEQGAADGPALLARARGDVEWLIAALYSEARYGGEVEIRIGGVALDQVRSENLLSAASGSPVAVSLHVKPGPVFLFGSIDIGQTTPTEITPLTNPEDYALVTGAPAKAETITNAIDKLVEAWRASGYPLAQIAKKEIVADHARSLVDVRLVVVPGSPAVYGWINVTGASTLETGSIARQSALEPGSRFNSADLKRTRERLRKFDSIESVRIVEGATVDDDGGIPITVEVTERKPRFFGATVSASTVDGAEVQAYWGHRNLFGEGESLKLDATVSQIGGDGFEGLQFDAGAVLTKPAVLDIDTDFFSELRIVRERPDTYESLGGKVRVGLAHRFDSFISGSLALEGSQSRIEDGFGDSNYTLLSLPGELVYDSRNNRLDPSHGINALAQLDPVAELSAGAAFGATNFRVASYVPLDDEDRVVLAGRVLAGSDFGASLEGTPATYRFFAGGGGSVRGYEYRSLGPSYNGTVVGGLSLLGASAELRMRFWERLGGVTFIDMATVSPDSVPSFSDPVFTGAGIGLRYYTSLGPIRIDVAAPTTHTQGQPKVGVYLGLGQAF